MWSIVTIYNVYILWADIANEEPRCVYSPKEIDPMTSKQSEAIVHLQKGWNLLPQSRPMLGVRLVSGV
jgi:hypothetical protein